MIRCRSSSLSRSLIGCRLPFAKCVELIQQVVTELQSINVFFGKNGYLPASNNNSRLIRSTLRIRMIISKTFLHLRCAVNKNKRLVSVRVIV